MKRFVLLASLALAGCSGSDASRSPAPPAAPETAPMPAAAASPTDTRPPIDREAPAAFETATFALG